MADKTTGSVNPGRKRGFLSKPIADGVTIGPGALVQMEGGFLNHWDQTGVFLGEMTGGDSRLDDGVITGNTSDLPPPRGRVDCTGREIKVFTLGGDPTAASEGDLVYCADSDIANATLTDTGSPPIGWLSEFVSGTEVHVQLFTPAEHLAGIADGTWIV